MVVAPRDGCVSSHLKHGTTEVPHGRFSWNHCNLEVMTVSYYSSGVCVAVGLWRRGVAAQGDHHDSSVVRLCPTLEGRNGHVALAPFGGRGEMSMSPPRRACPFFLHGDFVHVAPSVPQERAVPSACSKCSGRGVSFDAQPLWERRSALEGATTRAGVSVPAGRTGGIMGMLGPWCCLTSGHPPQGATSSKTGGRLTQGPAGTNPKTGQAAVIFFSLTVSSSSVSCQRSVCRLPR